MTEIAKGTVAVGLESQGFLSALDGMLGQGRGKLVHFAEAIGAVFVADKVIEFGKAAVDAAEAAQVSQEQLQKATENSGLAWQKWGQYLEQTAVQASKASGFMRDDIEGALSKLVTTTGSATQANSLLGLSMDLARARGLSLSQTSVILSKVWNGNTTSLTRLGISLPKVTTAQDALKNSSGKATEAQKEAAKAADLVSSRQAALAALQQKFGGQWEAYAGTAAGATDRFKASVNLLEAEIGKALLPVITAIATKLADWINQLEHSRRASDLAKTAVADLKTAISDLVQIGQGVIAFYGRWTTEVQALGALVAVGVVSWYAYRAAVIAAAVASRVAWVAMLALNAVMDANPVAIIILALAALAVVFVELWHRSSTFRDIVRESLHVIGQVAQTVFGVVKTVANAAWDVIKAFAGAIRDLAHSSAWGAVKSIAQTIFGAVKSAAQLVVSMVQGIASAIRTVARSSVWGTLKSVGKAVFGAIGTAVSDVLGFIDSLISKAQEAASLISSLNPLSNSSAGQGPGHVHYPHRAGGGPVDAMRPYMVGEQGPEMFIPRVSGQVISNQNLEGQGWGGVLVEVTPRDSEFARAIDVRIVRNDQHTSQAMRARPGAAWASA